MIALLLIIPIIGSLILIPIKENKKNNNIIMKNISLIASLLNFIISIFLWIEFDSSISQYQFIYEFNKLDFCHFNLGIDGISIYFVLLTTFITPIAILSNYSNINKNLKYFLLSILILETLQILAFTSLDLLLFYIFFESVLPIIFILIVLFGSGEDRFRSAFLLFLYTLAGSLPMLLSILLIYSYFNSTDFQLISLYEINLNSQKLLWLSLSFSKKDMTERIINKNKKYFKFIR
jgi:NADH-ubiquinone oxidoreductase chain 4